MWSDTLRDFVKRLSKRHQTPAVQKYRRQKCFKRRYLLTTAQAFPFFFFIRLISLTPRRPAQLLSSDDVYMQVVHALAPLDAVVDHHSESVFQFFLFRHSLRGEQ